MTRSDFHIERFRLRGSRVDISSTGEVAEANVPGPAPLTTNFQREQLAGALYRRTAGCAMNSRSAGSPDSGQKTRRRVRRSCGAFLEAQH
jgi:hypothetical protein